MSSNIERPFLGAGIVIIASTCAQVNFWARLIQALGVPPAGFSAECSILNLDAYTTRKMTVGGGKARNCCAQKRRREKNAQPVLNVRCFREMAALFHAYPQCF